MANSLRAEDQTPLFLSVSPCPQHQRRGHLSPSCGHHPRLGALPYEKQASSNPRCTGVREGRRGSISSPAGSPGDTGARPEQGQTGLLSVNGYFSLTFTRGRRHERTYPTARKGVLSETSERTLSSPPVHIILKKTSIGSQGFYK